MSEDQRKFSQTSG